MTRSELISELAASLGARHEARFIVDELLGSTPSSEVLDEATVDTIRTISKRRQSGEPLQYVLGHWAFRTLDLLVDPRVLIPRPETEQVVEIALHVLRESNAIAPLVVDAGTGSGAIALSIAAEWGTYEGGHIWATDASSDALHVAKANLDRVRHQDGGIMVPVSFAHGDWLSSLPAPLKGRVALVVANPPYIPASAWSDLPDDVRCEPKSALVAADGSDGTPGLGDVEVVLTQARQWLARPGVVVVELSPEQADTAGDLAQAMGFDDVWVEKDLAQRDRALVCRLR